MKKTVASILIAAALLGVPISQAALIINGNFTAAGWAPGTLYPATNATPNKLTSITGWTLLPANNIVGIGPNFASIPTPALELTGWNDAVFNSGLSQILGTTTGTNYTISFMVYDIGSLHSRINFSLNGNQLGSNLNAQGGSIVGGSTKGQLYSYNFTALGSDEISFLWPGPITGGNQVSILADVQVSGPAPSPVPEPGQVAASLLLLGGLGVYVFLKRRKVAKAAVAA